MPEKKREVSSAMNNYGMVMFYCTPSKEKKTILEFYPDLEGWIKDWVKSLS